ncbi:MAG: efflux RND transporter permease subunit, partial [Sulfitobacter sp.]|nr:efflux RND transporter permease subunit [Sulfitobacter sp.]
MIRSALSRLRPILLSVLTTVLGLLPLIVYRDILFYGMASLMAFGLLVGTLLTLGVVPVLYTLFLRI